MAPDPTAVATLGVLLLASGRGRWSLLVVPVLWCAISGATLLAMKAPDFWILPWRHCFAVALAIRQKQALRRTAKTRSPPPKTLTAFPGLGSC